MWPKVIDTVIIFDDITGIKGDESRDRKEVCYQSDEYYDNSIFYVPIDIIYGDKFVICHPDLNKSTLFSSALICLKSANKICLHKLGY